LEVGREGGRDMVGSLGTAVGGFSLERFATGGLEDSMAERFNPCWTVGQTTRGFLFKEDKEAVSAASQVTSMAEWTPLK
jgi:hypothetical protein